MWHSLGAAEFERYAASLKEEISLLLMILKDD